MWEKIRALGTWVLAITVAGALWFAYEQIKESHHHSQTRHLDELVRQFDESPLIDARRTLARSRIDEKHESLLALKPDDPPDDMYTILNFFNYVGLLEKRGYLDKMDVWDQFGYYIFAFYADAQPIISEAQKTDEPPWENVTFLMNDLQEIDGRLNHHALSNHTTQDYLYDFYAGEAKAQSGQPMPQGRRKKK